MTVVSTTLHTVDTAEQCASPYIAHLFVADCAISDIPCSMQTRVQISLLEKSLEGLFVFDPLQTFPAEGRFLRAQMFGRTVEGYWR